MGIFKSMFNDVINASLNIDFCLFRIYMKFGMFFRITNIVPVTKEY